MLRLDEIIVCVSSVSMRSTSHSRNNLHFYSALADVNWLGGIRNRFSMGAIQMLYCSNNRSIFALFAQEVCFIIIVFHIVMSQSNILLESNQIFHNVKTSRLGV
uniref:Uncharacterized protein n=1 Tax=Cacopsylla melanoneura TaxID=428564 RepID=A0A8D8RGR5_9HEMI